MCVCGGKKKRSTSAPLTHCRRATASGTAIVAMLNELYTTHDHNVVIIIFSLYYYFAMRHAWFSSGFDIINRGWLG